jgi:hypothetical protein
MYAYPNLKFCSTGFSSFIITILLNCGLRVIVNATFYLPHGDLEITDFVALNSNRQGGEILRGAIYKFAIHTAHSPALGSRSLEPRSTQRKVSFS